MGVGAGLYVYDVVVKKSTFAISSPDEFLLCKDVIVFSERELTFTFAICYRPSVCLSSVCRL